MPKTAVDKLADLLVEFEVLTSDQIRSALQSRERPDDTLDKVLIDKKLASHSTLLTLLMAHYHVPFIAMPEKVDVRVLNLVPEHLIETYQAVPIDFAGNELTVAMTAPDNTEAADRIAAATGYQIKPVGVLAGDYKRFFDKYFEDSTMTQILKEIEIHQKESALSVAEPVEEEETSKPLVKLVDTILNLAGRRRASDVHIEPQKDFALVRFRIDGVLQTQQAIPKATFTGVVSRLKVLAEIDITERRVPQDGKFMFRLGDREVDVRVATIPSRYGEKVALRILDRRSFLLSMGMLGMPEEMQESVNDVVGRPNGLFLVTGPTGSGKTTTLYAVIQKLRSPSLNVMTLEDPIEYELLAESRREGGITQIQINPKAGLDFSSGLRACLRQDPDILFVGEIRDRETAETAIRAALTGHMVLSSLHTNGAIQTVVRLLDMGLEPFMLVSAVRGIMSQRLVRVLCHHCKKAYTPPQEALRRLGLFPEEGSRFYRPQGCGACLQQGYWGRIGVFELFLLNNEVNKLILDKRPAGEIFKLASGKFGFKTLKQHGIELVSQGVTTIEEVLRVLPSL